MSILNNSLLLGAPAGATAYTIQRSLRFNSADSAYLSRTPSSAGNRKTWTWAAWVKRSNLTASRQGLFVCTDGTGTIYTGIEFDASERLTVYDSNVAGGVARTTTAVFRDVSSWYHILLAFDTTNATADNRIRLYVNGAEVTAFTTKVNPAQNSDAYLNSAVAHSIGSWAPAAALYFNGYLADIHLVDGSALTPSSFGEFDTNGVWQPKAFSGTYGTNGFKLDFSDNSNNTATTLGKDSSGNNNNWTPVNLSVTAGAGNDSLRDSPTNGSQTDTGAGGEVRGNYCTLNPLDNGGLTLANGNLDSSRATVSWASCRATIGITSGKWYWEISGTGTYNSSNGPLIGISKSTATLASYPGNDANGWGYYSADGQKYTAGSGSSYGASWTGSDVIGVAFDADNGTLTFYKNNTAQGTAFTGLTSGPYFPAVGIYGTATSYINFGQRPFAYTAPSGFKALCTANIPEGTITTSGSFTGNANADGPFVWLNGVPTAMSINGNAVTFGTHADKLANGFKVRSSSSSYNTAGSNTYSITTTGAKFKNARAQANP